MPHSVQERDVIELAFAQVASVIQHNSGMLLSAAAITAASAAYAYCLISARRTGVQLSLGRLEEFELERAVLLYGRAVGRLQDIRAEEQRIKAGVLARCRHRKQTRRRFAAELQDLRCYRAHLRSTILRLRSRPMQRFRRWLHRDSFCFALSRSLTLCLLVLVILTSCTYLAEQPELLSLLGGDAIPSALVGLQSLDDRMLDAGPIGAVVLAVATPVFYFYRRTSLRFAHRRQFRNLKKFAGTDPDKLVLQAPPIAPAAPEEPLRSMPDIAVETTWFSILGVSPSAGIDEVKQAYKLKIKQNHPDRVRDMSPLFRELAEAETKKLNAAYDEAMAALQAA
jgi:hypothetical protein